MRACILLLMLLVCNCAKEDAGDASPLSWDFPRTVCEGGYGRIHPLPDGSLLLTYSLSGNCYVRESRDGGATWGDAVLVMEAFEYEGIRVRCVNPEFVQLSASHPTHPGRIVFTANLRPADKKSSIHPFSIAVSVSDDGGASWSGRRIAYAPPLWDEDVSKGAWEPFAMELPDGRLQLYFTDNTPYYSTGDTRGNNISVVESADGGMSWGEAKIVCHTPGGWDGMPVVAGLDGRYFLAVEHKDVRGSDKAMEIKVRTTGPDFAWDGPSYTVGHKDCYCGAPYIIRTADYFIVSCQGAKGSDTPLVDKHAIPAVWYGRTMDDLHQAPKPINIDQTKYSGLWNSLCPLDGNSFYLVTQYRGKIVITKGTIK